MKVHMAIEFEDAQQLRLLAYGVSANQNMVVRTLSALIQATIPDVDIVMDWTPEEVLRREG